MPASPCSFVGCWLSFRWEKAGRSSSKSHFPYRSKARLSTLPSSRRAHAGSLLYSPIRQRPTSTTFFLSVWVCGCGWVGGWVDGCYLMGSGQALHVWNKHEKLGAVKMKSNQVHSLFFVRTGQNLVAINHA